MSFFFNLLSFVSKTSDWLLFLSFDFYRVHNYIIIGKCFTLFCRYTLQKWTLITVLTPFLSLSLYLFSYEIIIVAGWIGRNWHIISKNLFFHACRPFHILSLIFENLKILYIDFYIFIPPIYSVSWLSIRGTHIDLKKALYNAIYLLYIYYIIYI